MKQRKGSKRVLFADAARFALRVLDSHVAHEQQEMSAYAEAAEELRAALRTAKKS